MIQARNSGVQSAANQANEENDCPTYLRRTSRDCPERKRCEKPRKVPRLDHKVEIDDVYRPWCVCEDQKDPRGAEPILGFG